MKKSIVGCSLVLLASVVVMVLVLPAMAQEKPADNMKILMEKLKADKKLVVADNMDLTESEAKDFWPVYDAYQKDLEIINQRIVNLVNSYAEGYVSGKITDAKAIELATELVAIQGVEGVLPAPYVPVLSKILPMQKVLRYLQIENKIRAAVKYELATRIPLVE